MARRSIVLLAPLLAIAFLPFWRGAANAAPAYVIETVKTELSHPWSINFGPDGRLWFTSRNSATVQVSALNLSTGVVQVFTSSPARTVRVEGEAGVLGMALDPDFATNGWMYICYSYSDAGAKNRLSRFTLDANGGTIGQEAILIDAMVGAMYHNGCRVAVSPDNQYLFATMGDATNTSFAQNLTSTGGKTYRIFKNGAIPNDNPFYAGGQLPQSLVWTFGHRNPQGLAFQPGTGLLWSTEHGPNTRDELNILESGKNYGWPDCLGIQPSCPTVTNYAPAIAEYDTNQTVATSDMMFYTGGVFPDWQGNLFFVTLKTGRLYRLKIDNRAIVEQQILINGQYSRLRDVTVGPDGNIYIVTDADSATLLRIRTTSDLPYRQYIPSLTR